MTCIEHQQKGNNFGYGMMVFEGMPRRYHRAIYCISKGICWGDIIGMIIRHTCDNPRCINPDHLLIGTLKDNSNDRRVRGRAPNQKGELAGNHILKEFQVLEIRRIYSEKKLYQKDIAKSYGVSKQLISAIITRERWSHI